MFSSQRARGEGRSGREEGGRGRGAKKKQRDYHLVFPRALTYRVTGALVITILKTFGTY